MLMLHTHGKDDTAVVRSFLGSMGATHTTDFFVAGKTFDFQILCPCRGETLQESRSSEQSDSTTVFADLFFVA